MSLYDTSQQGRVQLLNSISVIQQQLHLLERNVQTGTEAELLIMQSAAIEDAVKHLMLQIVEDYLDHFTRPLIQADFLGQDTDKVLKEVKRILGLAHGET